MAAPLIWMAVYLTLGALVLLVCYNSPACRRSHRMERNQRITRMFSAPGKNPAEPLPGAPERVPTPR